MLQHISGNIVIQTFGECDTILELYSPDGSLLLGADDTDDNGYDLNAFLSYNFNANTEYIIRIRLYEDQSDSLTKLAVIPTYEYESYYDIYDLYDYTRGLTWSFAQNNVKVMTYEYSAADEYTFTVTSEVDTYLYIIDPRSTELIKSAATSSVYEDSLYNDDFGGTNDSQITKYFDEFVTYLVIVAAYNPSLSTSVGEFYLDVE